MNRRSASSDSASMSSSPTTGMAAGRSTNGVTMTAMPAPNASLVRNGTRASRIRQ